MHCSFSKQINSTTKKIFFLMILGGNLSSAAFIEIMVLQGEVYFHAIENSNCFSVINLIIFPQTTLNRILHRGLCPGNSPTVFIVYFSSQQMLEPELYSSLHICRT